MAWISPDTIKTIKQRADIVDVLSQYIDVIQKGQRYTALCPFHDDHDPSLNISPERQTYKCFVCGAGGDAINFIQRFDKLSYPQALAKLGKMVNVAVDVASDSHPANHHHELMTDYIQFLSYSLKTNPEALAYLESRGLHESLQHQFELGYAPDGSQSLKFLQAKGYDINELVALDLVKEQHAVFHHRIMIPIHDEYGRPIGFTARVLNDTKTAKYINTSTTPLFQKSRVVFNYHRAKQASKQANRIILVEGAMDVLAFAKAGIHEAVACLGTALTTDQIRLINQLKVPIILCYDGDKAGQAATMKAIDAFDRVDVSVVAHQSNLDPDEIVSQQGADGLAKLVNQTVSVVEFAFNYLQTEYQLANYEDKRAYAVRMEALIKKSSATTFEADTYLSQLTQKTGFTFSSAQLKQSTRPVVVVNEGVSGIQKAMRVVLASICVSAAAYQRFKEELGYFPNDTMQQLAYYVFEVIRQQGKFDEDLLNALVEQEEMRQAFQSLKLDQFTYSQALFEDCLLKLKIRTIKDKISQLKQQAFSLTDPVQKAALIDETKSLLIQLSQLQRKDEMDERG